MVIHNGQRVLMQCYHGVKCFPCYILVKNIIFNSYCPLFSGRKPKICLHFLTRLLSIKTDFQMSTQMVCTISCCSLKLLVTMFAPCLPNSIIITHSCEFVPNWRSELPLRAARATSCRSPILRRIICSIIDCYDFIFISRGIGNYFKRDGWW